MNPGMIACIKNRFWRRQIGRATDLIDLGITENFYKIEIFRAITKVYLTTQWNLKK